MSLIGGSIESVSIKGRTFSVAADADASRKIGGVESEVQSNGDGTARKVQTRVAWMIGGLVIAIDNALGHQEFLQEIADSPDFVAMDITFADETTYQGLGTITGELNYSSQNGTAELTLSGPGKLTRQ